jgi:hypothetical protein
VPVSASLKLSLATGGVDRLCCRYRAASLSKGWLLMPTAPERRDDSSRYRRICGERAVGRNQRIAFGLSVIVRRTEEAWKISVRTVTYDSYRGAAGPYSMCSGWVDKRVLYLLVAKDPERTRSNLLLRRCGADSRCPTSQFAVTTARNPIAEMAETVRDFPFNQGASSLTMSAPQKMSLFNDETTQKRRSLYERGSEKWNPKSYHRQLSH